MSESSNVIIDTLDSLMSASSHLEKWASAENVSDSLGYKSLLVARANPSTKSISWINTNLSSNWMEEYLGMDYATIDPLFMPIRQGEVPIKVEFGHSKRPETRSTTWHSMDHGLSGLGFSSMVSYQYARENTFENTTIVTLGFNEPPEKQGTAKIAQNAVVAALFASHLDRPMKGISYSSSSKARLTNRQMDVLYCLGLGYQTARISERLGISEASVNFHLAAAKKAVNAKTREQALAIALLDGLIEL